MTVGPKAKLEWTNVVSGCNLTSAMVSNLATGHEKGVVIVK